MFIVCGIFLFAVPVYAENPTGAQDDFAATGVQLRSEPEASSSLPANAELKDSQSDSKSDVDTVFNDSMGEGSHNASSTAKQGSDSSGADRNNNAIEDEDSGSNSNADATEDKADGNNSEEKPEKANTPAAPIFANAVFNSDYYLNNNQDVLNAYGNDGVKAYRHFLSYGVYEGRRGSGSFDVVSYYNEYPDLRAAFGTDIWRYYDHYLRIGQAEGRHPSGCSGLVGAPTVYGGTDYSAVYDPAYYLDRNPDLKAAFSRS